MGIIIKQSIRNTLVTYIGFAIGAANTLYMYPQFLGKTYYGLTGYLLSSGNVIMPLMAFGVHNTLVKFFSDYRTEADKRAFLNFVLLLPLLCLLPMALIGYLSYDGIAAFLSRKNPIIADYVWQIPVIGLCMGYFEIFYAWVKVHLQSVFGGFIKEIGLRLLITAGLYAVHFGWLSPPDFVNALMLCYALSLGFMVYYAHKVHPIRWRFRFPDNKKAVLGYSVFIILSGSIANMLLDIDKNMIGQYIRIENIAYYSVAIFIATVIAVPSRAMHQIAYPITARLMSNQQWDELNALYQKTSLTLQIVGGWVFVGILVNIKAVYQLLPPEYAAGIPVVFIIGASKYIDLLLGNNNAIIFNSKYYRAVLFLGLLLAVLAISLNAWLIPIMGILGSALATLISIVLYSMAKWLFVVFKMKLYPFTCQTLYALGILVLCFVAVYPWDCPGPALLNIAVKSTVVSLLYWGMHYRWRISADINGVIDQIWLQIREKLGR